LPEAAIRFPDRCVQDARVRLVDGQIDRAGLVTDEEHMAPGLAAIGALEHPPLGVAPEGMTERRDPDGVRVAGMDPHLADMARLSQADVLPGPPGIGALVDAVTVGDVDPD